MDTSIWFENGALHEKRSKLQAMTASQPVLRFRMIFAEHSWSTDVFALFQNCIRHEIQDLYTMLQVASFRLEAIQVSDSQLLLKWLVEFEQLIALYFSACDDIIYPTVLRRQRDSALSVMDLRRRTKSLTENLLEIHHETLEFTAAFKARDDMKLINFDNEILHQRLEKLCGCVFSFVANLEQFFTWETEKVAVIVEKYMSKEEARELEKKAVANIVSNDAGEFVWGGIAQWVPSEVKSSYLGYVCRSKAFKLRRKERKWVRVHKTARIQFAKS